MKRRLLLGLILLLAFSVVVLGCSNGNAGKGTSEQKEQNAGNNGAVKEEGNKEGKKEGRIGAL